ncbi:hypothetical protein NPIL_319391 [Nephila pilipes]|uniref:Uncharacterized protein n=1 Tax=Nephila pilipes TaxID=299642 RepID=A0A8X6TBD3_NEPPI|nr:hypothetical protein NPIL_319391 [Nephila pilipes]
MEGKADRDSMIGFLLSEHEKESSDLSHGFIFYSSRSTSLVPPDSGRVPRRRRSAHGLNRRGGTHETGM